MFFLNYAVDRVSVEAEEGSVVIAANEIRQCGESLNIQDALCMTLIKGYLILNARLPWLHPSQPQCICTSFSTRQS
jgi:hypothetical protein